MNVSCSSLRRRAGGNFFVIVPVYNGGQRWREAAYVLAEAVDDGSRVVVVDSASTDGSCEVARRCGFTVEVIDPRLFSHGGTRQLAVERYALAADYVVLMTQDAILEDSGSISALLDSFSDTDVAAAYGRQLPHRDASAVARHFCAFNYGETSFTKTLEDAPQLGIKTAYISNSFAAYRVSDLLQVGGFPDWLIAGEDVYVAFRLLQIGRSVRYCAEAQVRHSHDYRLHEEVRRYFDFGVMHAQLPDLLATLGTPEAEGIRLALSELSGSAGTSPARWASLVYREAARYLGYRLGRHFRALPGGACRRISMAPQFWDRRERAGHPSGTH